MALLLRSLGAVGGIDEPPAAQAFERPRLSHPHHVPTLRSALVDRASQNVIRGPIFSSCLTTGMVDVISSRLVPIIAQGHC